MDQRLQRYTFFYLYQNVFSNNFKKQLGVIVTVKSKFFFNIFQKS